MEISIVLPAFNEEASISRALDAALKYAEESFDKFEILIIDDASIDKTLAIAKQYQGKFGPEKIKIIENSKNIGQGPSLLKGFQAANYEWIAHNGVDLSFDFQHLPRVLEQHQDSDLIIVMRKDRSAYNFWRKIISIGFVRLINGFHRTDVSDFSFVQIFKKELVSLYFDESYNTTSFLMPSFILNVLKSDKKTVCISFDYHPRLAGRATGASLRNIYIGFRDLIRYSLINKS